MTLDWGDKKRNAHVQLETMTQPMMRAQTYRKRPIEVRAIQYTGINADVIIAWSKGVVMRSDDFLTDCLLIGTRDSLARVDRGDWIVQGIKGEFYPVKNDVFEETYDPTIT